MSIMEQVEQVIKERVRPGLVGHEGDIEVVSLEGDRLTVRFLGQCSGCPAAHMTMEELVRKEIMEQIPEISEVILDDGVSDDMLDFARQLLSQKRV